MRGNGRAVRTTVGLNLDLGFKGPTCPTAQGILEAKDGLKARITTETLRSNGTVSDYYTQVIFQDTKLTGEVGDDAKLKTLKIKDTLRLAELSGGSLHMSIDSKITRETEVNMRNGQYDLGKSKVQVSVAAPRDLRESSGAGPRPARRSGSRPRPTRAFAATVKRAIEKYREREAGWQKPDVCRCQADASQEHQDAGERQTAARSPPRSRPRRVAASRPPRRGP